MVGGGRKNDDDSSLVIFDRSDYFCEIRHSRETILYVLFFEDLDIILKSIKESHTKNKENTSAQAETISFPEELLESLVLSAMGQGRNREEQTLLALHELGEKLGFCGEDEETTILFEQSEQTMEKKRAYIEKVRKGNKQRGKQ